MNIDLYLSDEQYLKLLDKSEALISKFDKFYVVDCDEIGIKDTTSNIGLCNDDAMADEENVLFPADYAKYGRTDIKYRKNHHICPYDLRLNNVLNEQPANMGNGCFYTCSLRNTRTNKEKIFNLVEKTRELALSGKAKEMVEKSQQLYENK